MKAINPATGKAIADIKSDTKRTVGVAIRKARGAYERWASVQVKKRCELIEDAADYIESRKGEYAEVLRQEAGKVHGEAEREVASAVRRMRYVAENAPSALAREEIAQEDGSKSYIEYEPRGVVGVITPWNYPLSIPSRTIAEALAAGNTVVHKPSEHSTLTGKKLGEAFGCFGEAFQTVVGGPRIGEALTKGKVDSISFTGSIASGKRVFASSAKGLHKLTLELGGKDPFIVLEDADLDKAAQMAVKGAFTNAGQLCISVERVLVQKPIAIEFTRKVVDLTRGIKVGEDMGPLISEGQRRKVEMHVHDAVRKGAKVLAGGKRVPGEGYFFEPTVLTNASNKMMIMKEETFGPVLPIMEFETGDEAVELANSTEYGLGASVWTRDLGRGQALARRIRAGTVWVNSVLQIADNCPFGGVKQSGIGREYGAYGIREFTDVKHVSVRG